jgi:hypothetical protein
MATGAVALQFRAAANANAKTISPRLRYAKSRASHIDVLVIAVIVRVATFNVENLFSRVRSLNADTQTNKQVMEDATRLQESPKRPNTLPSGLISICRIGGHLAS